MPVHPRDVLFVDGAPLPVLPVCQHFAGNEKFITKAFAQQRATAVAGGVGTAGAAAGASGRRAVFDVICDLEDGAAAGQERQTAEMVAALIASADNSFARAGVRIHDASHPHCMKDVEILVRTAGAKLAFITLPKCDGRMDALKILSYINHVAEEAGIKRRIPMHVMIETHRGLREVFDIVELPQIEGVTLGIMDFVSSFQGAVPASAMSSPGQFEHPLTRRAALEVSTAGLGHGAVPIHPVTQDYKDLSVAGNDARRARAEFGYLAKYSIHPDQIAPIVRGMQPSQSDMDDACAILLAAQAQDWGPVGHQGKLHDRASYRYYWQLLDRAQKTGADVPADAHKAFFAHA